MKDADKTRAQLIAEVQALRRQSEALFGQRQRQRQALARVHEAMGRAQNSDEAGSIVIAIRQCLQELGLSFHACYLNLLDTTDPPGLSTYSSFSASGADRTERWLLFAPDEGAEVAARIWMSKGVAYRPDLEAEDEYGERHYVTRAFGAAVRSLLDVPFSHGTVGLNSTCPRAFSKAEIALFQDLAAILSSGFRHLDDLQQLTFSAARYRTLVETPDLVVVLMDADGHYLYISPQIEAWSGYAPAEFYADSQLTRRMIHPRDLRAALQVFAQAFHGAPIQDFEFRWRGRRQKQWMWGAAKMLPIYDSDEDRAFNLVNMVQIVILDITERKEAEAQLRASLGEKEILLKEIHHRVKNNLQIISSLSNLQARRIRDPQALAALEDNQARIRAMALIHEKLYNAPDLSHVDFEDYIRHLATYLFQSHSASAEHITLKVHIEKVLLDIDTAIPCGLIVNELVSNSLKYAFAGGRGGTIHIDMAPDPGRGVFDMEIGDDGAGFPAEVDFRRTRTLGLQLVGTLVKQLRGTLALQRAPGTTFRLSFPLARPKSAHF